MSVMDEEVLKKYYWVFIDFGIEKENYFKLR